MRQALLQLMKGQLGYPSAMLVVEKELSQLPHLQKNSASLPQRRIDLLVYRKSGENLLPLLLVECKAEHADRKAIEQLMGYNHYVGAPFVAVVSKTAQLTGWQGRSGLEFSEGLFTYEQLLNS
ncbi:MAG: type I restriction enzyme HsdR N-terminal domain-containing protein [Candidatus Algichlamydia australiensis]|nr:type I restriction enzyme HsdR N-terminal domain-containing protein [Chlamydiales bacterium]